MKGIIVTRWDDKLGIVVEGKYPPTLNISEDHMMRIFTTHAMGGGEAGFLSMMVENINIASYYTGLPKEGSSQYYVALILEKDEAGNPDLFEEALIETANNLIPQVKNPAFSEILKENFFKLPQLLEISTDMRYANIFRNERRSKALQKLSYGVCTLEELQKWLSDQFDEEILDLDNVLLPFDKNNMIRQFTITKEDNEEIDCVFLVKDVFIMRSPAEKLYKMAKDGSVPEMKKIFNEYIETVEDYFKEYKLDDEDNKNIAAIMADPDLNYLMSVLRENYREKNELIETLNKSADEVDKLINTLKQNDIIQIYTRKKTKDNIIVLKCDIKFPEFFPEYLIDSIRRRWMEEDIEQELALAHLELLKGVFKGEEELALEEIEEEEGLIAAEEMGKGPVEVPLKAETEKIEEVKIPSEYREEKREEVAEPVAPTLSDEEIFKMTSEVNTLRAKAKTLLSKKEYEDALVTINKAIGLSEKLVEAGNTKFKKRIKKFENVVETLNRLIEKKQRKEEEEVVDKSALMSERTKILADADDAFTSNEFESAIELLEKAIDITNKLGEDPSEIQAMVDNIKSHLNT
ncbi:MAG: hypothetical protein GF329_03605 [Candidatus Lokiarchaeota archaeon]|nr:hypothetical protein [Candidatus Lokiarchaeota archaeon]